jgi:hypothetical protein
VSYSVDTSALISSWNEYHPPDTHPTFWTNLEVLIKNEELRAPEEVLVELEKKDDAVYAWAYERRELLFVPLYAEVQLALKAIMREFPRIIAVHKNRSGADPWVIALAKVENRDVVTNERESNNLNKPHIPDVCREMGIRCITMHELIREQGWRF